MNVLKVQKLSKEKWINRKFEKLHDGDMFRVFKSNGEAIVGSNGKINVFIAHGNAYLNDDGIWTIDVIK